MNRELSNLGPALFLAVVMLVASALAAVAPHAAWTAVASPLLLVLALVGTDLYLLRRRRYSAPRSRPSSSVLLMAGAILVACAIIAVRDLDQIAGMIPILGSCAALPVILRRDRSQCA